MEGERTSSHLSPLWGGQGGGADSALAEDANKRVYSAADAAGPPPTSPTSGEGKKQGFKRLSLPTGATARSRHLRKEMTQPEKRLWTALRTAFPGQHWRKQVPFGPYIADFCSHGSKLIIECDGGQHAEAGDYDAARTRFLEAEGYRVQRFWNNDVSDNIGGVVEAIAQALSPSPSQPLAGPLPLPVGEGQ